MNEAQKAVKVSSKAISVVMKIGYIAMLVVMCLCAVILLFMAATGGETSITTVGGVHFVVADDVLVSPASFAAALAALLVMAVFLFVIFLLTHRVFRQISETGAPFQKRYVRTIRVIGILVVAMGIVLGVVSLVAAACTGAEPQNLYANAPGVLVGAIIFCLSYIFDYGCALQERVDEAQ